MTHRDSSLKHISTTLARRPNKCITLSQTNLSNTGNSPRDSDIPIMKLTPGLHVGSLEGPAPVGERGERDRVYEGGGGGDLTQPPANFSKFLVHYISDSFFTFDFLAVI